MMLRSIGAVLRGGSFFYAGRGEVVRVFINEEIGGEVLSCWKLWPRAGLPSGAYAGSVKHAGFTSRLGWIVFLALAATIFRPAVLENNLLVRRRWNGL